MKVCRLFFVLLVMLVLSDPACAQNSLSVSDRSAMTLDLTPALSAGINTELIADSTQWINYSFEINPAEPFASISVEIISGSIPDGVELYLQAGHYVGNSRGRTGRPTGKIRLDHVPKVLINDIGTSFTGHGKREGHQLILTMVITDFALLQSGDFSFFLQYTLNQ